ncbi:hypothetical protein GW17_00045042, partial [Ensete ventricosum]
YFIGKSNLAGRPDPSEDQKNPKQAAVIHDDISKGKQSSPVLASEFCLFSSSCVTCREKPWKNLRSHVVKVATDGLACALPDTHGVRFQGTALSPHSQNFL